MAECDGSGLSVGAVPDPDGGPRRYDLVCPGCAKCQPCPTCKRSGHVGRTSISDPVRKQCPDCHGSGHKDPDRTMASCPTCGGFRFDDGTELRDKPPCPDCDAAGGRNDEPPAASTAPSSPDVPAPAVCPYCRALAFGGQEACVYLAHQPPVASSGPFGICRHGIVRRACVLCGEDNLGATAGGRNDEPCDGLCWGAAKAGKACRHQNDAPPAASTPPCFTSEGPCTKPVGHWGAHDFGAASAPPPSPDLCECGHDAPRHQANDHLRGPLGAPCLDCIDCRCFKRGASPDYEWRVKRGAWTQDFQGDEAHARRYHESPSALPMRLQRRRVLAWEDVDE